MTPAEAAALLTVAAAFDNRKPDADQARAWALALDGLRFQDCRDAIVKHYQGSREWMMPVDVRTRVKRLRDDRIDAYGPIEPPADLDPSDTRAYSEWFTSTLRAIGDGTLMPPPPIESVDGPPELAAAIGKLEAGWNVHDKRRRVAPVGSVLPAVTEPHATAKDDA